jgi:molybdenum cofactor cytidylyltransferase
MSAGATHIAIVLAAGGSRRLGRAKQLLSREGETLVHRAVRLAAATGPARLLLLTGAHAAQIQAAVAGGFRVEVLFNPRWEEGLASTIRLAAVALADLEAPCLVLGCDQPALELEHLQRLLAGAAAAASGCSAASHDGMPGIPAVVTASLLKEATNLEGDRGLRAALRQLPAGSIALLEAPELGFDLDTPADVDKAINEGLLDPVR